MRRRLVLRSRRSRPIAELVVGDSGGAHLYLVVGTHPVSLAIELEDDQVDHLADVLMRWRVERASEQTPFGRPFSSEQSRAV